MISDTDLASYNALTGSQGVVKLPQRSLIKMTGADRATFLHNFCTADIKGMADEATGEAFILDGKGKTIGHVLLLNSPSTLWLSGVGAQSERLIEHLDRYIIRDDVQLEDVTNAPARPRDTRPRIRLRFTRSGRCNVQLARLYGLQ